MAGLQTEFSFTLPKGYVDEFGVLHRRGVMRLATARDEIEPLRSADINGPDDPYLTVLVLARVVKELGSLSQITPDTVVNLFAADLAFLQDLYGIINFGDPADIAALQATVSMPVEDPPGSAFGDMFADLGEIDDVSTAEGPDSDDAAFASTFDDEHGANAGHRSPVRSRARVEEVRRASAP